MLLSSSNDRTFDRFSTAGVDCVSSLDVELLFEVVLMLNCSFTSPEFGIPFVAVFGL